MRVYVAGAGSMPDHQDLQVRWSQICAEIFGRVASDVGEMSGAPLDLHEIESLLVGWLNQAPYLSGDDGRVRILGDHLGVLQTRLTEAIAVLEKG